MNIHFNLKDPSAEKSPVRLVVTHLGKVYRAGVGFSVETARWSKSKERTGVVALDRRLKEIRMILESRLNDLSTPREVERAITAAITGGEGQREGVPTFWEFFQDWAEQDRPGRNQRTLAYRSIKRMMGGGENWDDIDMAYYSKLVRKMQKEGWSVNYQGNTVKHLKTVMHEGIRLGYHTNSVFREFHKMSEDVDKIYLNAEEMERIWDFPYQLQILRKARDLAWLGYLTCARFSDYSRLSLDSIGADGFIRFSQQKTARRVVLPCSPRVREILERNGGRAPVLTQQKFNSAIKEVCSLAGIDDLIEYSVSEGARHVRKQARKCELVSSHTFRRSAATNLYLQGIPLKAIMQLTGHSTIAMLEKYLRVSHEENAHILQDIPFFK